MLDAPLCLRAGLLAAALFVVACHPIQPPTPQPTAHVVAPAPPPDDTRTTFPTPTVEPTAEPTVKPTPAPTADRQLKAGFDAHAAGDYEEAVAAFTEAIALDPNLATAYVFRAAAYLRLGEFEAAVADCDAALRLDSEDADAYLYRGVAYSYLAEYDAAVTDLNNSIRLNPTSVNAHVYRGTTYFLLGQYAATIQDCTQAIHLSGGYFLPAELCLNVMGELVAPDFEDADAALQEYDAAIRQNPEHAAAYLFRGLTLRNQGKIEQAIGSLEEALRLDPALGDILLMYWAYAYLHPSDPAAAITELETALALVEPDSLLAGMIMSSINLLRADSE